MSSPKKQPLGNATKPRELIPSLVRMVRARFHWLGWARSEEAVMKAIEHWWERDKTFLSDADKEVDESVVSSLYACSCREVGNMQRADRRRCERRQEYARRIKNSLVADFFVPNGHSAENISIEDQLDLLEKLLEGVSLWEREFVKLRLQGCRYLGVFAKLLGVDGCSVKEQRQQVNKAWNGLRKRLQRGAKKQEQGDGEGKKGK